MKKAVSVLAAITMAAVVLPAAASAREIKVGVTSSPLIAPTCPADAQGTHCRIVLTQVTAYETRRDGVKNPTTINQSGEIASFTLGLTGTSTITTADLLYLNKTYGGPPEAQLTVLRPVGTAKNPQYRVAAQSSIFQLRPDLGQVAEFPLIQPLPVVRGEVLALTVPTWAPVLSFELDKTKFSYSQSRGPLPASTGAKPTCSTSASANLAQLTIGALSNYNCGFAGTRVEYSALEIVTPPGFVSNIRRREAKAAKRRLAIKHVAR